MLADDGDPLDVLIPVDKLSFTGCLLDVRSVGLLNTMDERRADQKVLAVA